MKKMCYWRPSELCLLDENLSIICNLLMKNSGNKYRFYYPHRSRDLVSPVCGIFLQALVNWLVKLLFLSQLFSNCIYTLDFTACYAGLLLAPVEGFGLRPRLFCPFGQKKGVCTLFLPISGHFWCSVVTSVLLRVLLNTKNGLKVWVVTLVTSLKNSKIPQKIPKRFFFLNLKISKIQQKIQPNKKKIPTKIPKKNKKNIGQL